MQEVTGSIPVFSTTKITAIAVVFFVLQENTKKKPRLLRQTGLFS